ncbi:MAG: hypothetical protein ACT4OW_01460 [Nitrososphaerota archaeon]
MKKSELRKLIAEYTSLKIQSKQKESSYNQRISDKLKELEHRYFHETGRNIESDLKQQE